VNALKNPRCRGVVAVIQESGKLLVIERSAHVVAPGAFCFPGGGILDGETEEQALVRELEEELSVTVDPVKRLWESVTPWQVELAWWQARLPAGAVVTPNPAEVAHATWLTPAEMLTFHGLLESNLSFLSALAAGQFDLDA